MAAEVPQEMLEALSETSALLRDSVRGRYVGPVLFHVTLAFLGELPASDVDRLALAIDEACATQAAFSTTLGALGTFGRPSSAVLWQGFSDAQDKWSELAHAVRSSLAAYGYEFDAKGFLPHITLMRRADVSRGELPMPRVERSTISEVTLFKSDLSGGSRRYEALASWDLA